MSVHAASIVVQDPIHVLLQQLQRKAFRDDTSMWIWLLRLRQVYEQYRIGQHLSSSLHRHFPLNPNLLDAAIPELNQGWEGHTATIWKVVGMGLSRISVKSSTWQF